MRVILEGLTGTGKSQTIAAMGRLALLPPRVVDEEATFGDLMDEIAGGVPARDDLVRRLDRVLEALPGAEAFLLERFHLSYFALVPVWEHYAAIDARLAALGAKLVLLRVPDGALRGRSLRRREHGGEDWQDFSTRFGSEDNALATLRQSQDRRVEALALTRIPHLTVDTAAEDWEAVARTIAAFANA